MTEDVKETSLCNYSPICKLGSTCLKAGDILILLLHFLIQLAIA